jgi:prepilin-type processing-associated H-X9-DG protein
LLVGILLPALNRARAQAQTVACLANLRSIGQAIQIYTINHKGILPFGDWDGDGSPDGREDTPTYSAFFTNSTPNATDWELLLISNALHRGGDNAGNQTVDTAKLQQTFVCPGAKEDRGTSAIHATHVLHYSCHPRLMPRLDDHDLSIKDASGNSPLMTPYKIASVRYASDIAMIWDGNQNFLSLDGNAAPVATGLDSDGVYRGDNSDPTHHGPWNYLLRGNGVNMQWAPFASNLDVSNLNGNTRTQKAEIRWRHRKNDTANFLFADGHADSISLKQNVNSDLKLRNLYVNPK